LERIVGVVAWRLGERGVSGALSVIGGGAGLAIAWTSTHRPSPAWAGWAVIATALTAASGAMFPYGARRWRELNSIAAVTVRAVAPHLVAVWVGVAILGAVYEIVFLPLVGRVDWRAGLLITIAGAGTLPALATMVGIRYAAPALTGDAPDVQLLGLVRLRRLLQALLVTLGGIVALLVVAQASAARSATNASPLVTVLFGAAMSAVVAAVYAPAAATLRTCGSSLVDACLPVAGKTGADLVDVAEQRAKMEAMLGVDRTLFSDLQTNLAVVGPLIASAAATLLPR
jgi:hypothetical protein